MENVSYVVLSYMTALQRHMDVLANNVANMNSTAFRGERPLFQQFLITAEDGSETAFVEDVGLIRDTSEGAIVKTSNPLDVALSGKGFFVVDTIDGPRYTRNGHWRLDELGQIVVGVGNPVVDDAGLPIVITPEDGRIPVRAHGTILSDAGPIAKVDVVTFADEQALEKLGDGLMDALTQIPEPATNFSVLQGMVETSNVNGVVEMTLMMEVVNAYRTTQQMNSSNDELRRRAIQTIGRVLTV